MTHPNSPPAPGPLLTTTEVAALFGVTPGTAALWAKDGKLDAIRTPGGRWRFPESPVRALLNWSQR
jgi:excisionase family DNA binding protein